MSAEVLIVGGGLAGAAAAISLARSGRSVVLLEREAFATHKVCGEFLSGEALSFLQHLRIDVQALGAVPLSRVRVAGRTTSAETSLPFAAMSLTRRALDEAMLAAACSGGVTVRRGQGVTSLVRSATGWTATLGRDGDSITAPAAMLATGKHDLRGWPRPDGVQSELVAFKMYWRLTPPQLFALGDAVELVLFRGGYAGLQPVEDGTVNLCCVVRKDRLRELGGQWAPLLAAMQADSGVLRQRLADATPLLARPLAVSSIPYGYVREQTPGLWALGDQAAVIPSFTGDGMSIALYSGLLAARMYLARQSPEAYQQRLAALLQPQVRFATKLSQVLVSSAGQRVAVAGLRLYPGAMQGIARLTRLQNLSTSAASFCDQS